MMEDVPRGRAMVETKIADLDPKDEAAEEERSKTTILRSAGTSFQLEDSCGLRDPLSILVDCARDRPETEPTARGCTVADDEDGVTISVRMSLCLASAPCASCTDTAEQCHCVLASGPLQPPVLKDGKSGILWCAE